MSTPNVRIFKAPTVHKFVPHSLLEYTSERSQAAMGNGLAFSIGEISVSEIKRELLSNDKKITFIETKQVILTKQLFPFCWCRDVFCSEIEKLYHQNKSQKEPPELVLLIADRSFQGYYASTLQNNLLKTVPTYLLSNHVQLKIPTFDYLETNRKLPFSCITYQKFPQNYFKYSAIMSYIALLNRVFSYNTKRRTDIEQWVKESMTVGLYDASMLEMLFPLNKFYYALDPVLLDKIPEDRLVASGLLKLGPYDFLRYISYYTTTPSEDHRSEVDFYSTYFTNPNKKEDQNATTTS